MRYGQNKCGDKKLETIDSEIQPHSNKRETRYSLVAMREKRDTAFEIDFSKRHTNRIIRDNQT